ncbi:MAG: PGPGW domain-containing protein [Gaiellaceae bacterium]
MAEGRGKRTIERIREQRERHKQRGRLFRLSFAVFGFSVLVGGIVLSLPFVPGPGIVLIGAGLAILALEFAWAERLLERVLDQIERAGERASGASRARKAVIVAATVAGVSMLVAAVLIWDVPGVPV